MEEMDREEPLASGRVVSPLSDKAAVPRQPFKTTAPFLVGETPEGSTSAPAAVGASGLPPTCIGQPAVPSLSSPLSGLVFPLSEFMDLGGRGDEGPELYPSLLPLLPAAPMTRLRRSSAHSGASSSPFRLDGNVSHEEATHIHQGSGVLLSPEGRENFYLQQEHERLEVSKTTDRLIEVQPESGCRRSSLPLGEEGPAAEPSDAKGGRNGLPFSLVGQRESLEGLIASAWQQRLQAARRSSNSSDSLASDARLREETRRNTERNASPIATRLLHSRLLQQHLRPTVRKSSSPLVRGAAAAAAAAAFAAASSAPVTPLRPQRETSPRANAACARNTAAAPTPAAATATAAPATAASGTPSPVSSSAAVRVSQSVSPVRSILRAPTGPGSARSLSGRRVNFTPQQEGPAGAAAAGVSSPWSPPSAAAARAPDDSAVSKDPASVAAEEAAPVTQRQEPQADEQQQQQQQQSPPAASLEVCETSAPPSRRSSAGGRRAAAPASAEQQLHHGEDTGALEGQGEAARELGELCQQQQLLEDDGQSRVASADAGEQQGQQQRGAGDGGAEQQRVGAAVGAGAGESHVEFQQRRVSASSDLAREEEQQDAVAAGSDEQQRQQQQHLEGIDADASHGAGSSGGGNAPGLSAAAAQAAEEAALADAAEAADTAADASDAAAEASDAAEEASDATATTGAAAGATTAITGDTLRSEAKSAPATAEQEVAAAASERSIKVTTEPAAAAHTPAADVTADGPAPATPTAVAAEIAAAFDNTVTSPTLETSGEGTHDTAAAAAAGSGLVSQSVVGYSSNSSSCWGHVRVFGSEGPTEMLIEASGCFAAATLSEPLQAEPTPRRKMPSRPPSRAEAHAAAQAHWRASRAGGAASAAAAGITDADTPEIMRDEEMEGHKDSSAVANRLTLRQQQQHGLQGPDSLRSPATGSLEEPPKAVEMNPTQSLSATPVAVVSPAALGVGNDAALASAAAVPEADGAEGAVDNGTHKRRSLSSAEDEDPLRTRQQHELMYRCQQQQQQERLHLDDRELRTSGGSSDSSSAPLTPFAGPDPLSGDVPLSPRVRVTSEGGEARLVSASAASFLLSVRQQLEAEATEQQQQRLQEQQVLQQQEQQHQPQQQHCEETEHEAQHPTAFPEGCNTKDEEVQQLQGEGKEQHAQRQPQEQENQQQPKEAMSQQQQRHEQPEQQEQHRPTQAVAASNDQLHQGQQQQEQQDQPRSGGVRNSSNTLKDSFATRRHRGSTVSSGAAGVRYLAEPSAEEALSRSDASRGATRFISENNSRRASGTETSTSGAAPAANEDGSEDGSNSSSCSSSVAENPQWRTQWRALDALTSKLLQGLPRALTAIVDDEDQSALVAAALAVAAEPAAESSSDKAATETEETGTAAAAVRAGEGAVEAHSSAAGAAEASSLASCISWVKYREEWLRTQQLQLEEQRSQRQTEPPQQQQQVLDGEAESLPDAGIEEVEVQQLLQRRLEQRAAAIAATAAEQLLLHAAKTRAEWASTCAKTQEVLQHELQQQLQPLTSKLTKDLQQLDAALQDAACRVESATKRRRLSNEPWEAGFVAIAEDRHVALQEATGGADAAAAALGALLEEEAKVSEEIEAAEAEIRAFADTSADLRLLADIRHKESVVEAFERLSGMRILRVNTTGLVAELAWPRSFAAAAALHQLPAATAAAPNTAAPSSYSTKLPQRLNYATDAPVPSARITISWSSDVAQKQQQQLRGQTTRDSAFQQLQLRSPALPPPVTAAAAAAATAAAGAAAEPRTPPRQRVQILKPCLPPGGLPFDSSVCTPLLAQGRKGAFNAEATGTVVATGASAVEQQRQQPQQREPLGCIGVPQFLPITSCKLQSRFPVLRAAAAAAAASGRRNAEALPPHRRWLYSVEMLRYLLLGAVQRSLQQMLLQQRMENGGDDWTATGAQGLRRSAAGMDEPRRSAEMSSLTSAGSDSSNTATAAAGRRPFPDLSTVRALLLHAHAASGRVALLHDQLLLLLRSFRGLTSVEFEDKEDATLLPLLKFRTAVTPSDEELPVLQLSLAMDLNEALSRGSLLIAVAEVQVNCLSDADDLCDDGQAACSNLRGAIASRLEALWDADKQEIRPDELSKVYADEGLVKCLYSACKDCNYARAIEDWRRCADGEARAAEEDEAFFEGPCAAAEAAALAQWVNLLEETGIVPS